MCDRQEDKCCCCCRGPRGRRGPQGEQGPQGPPGVYAQDLLPFGNSYVQDPQFFIRINNNFGEIENFTTQTPPEQSFQLNTPNIFTPTAPLIINISATFEFSYAAPVNGFMRVQALGDSGVNYLGALATTVSGNANTLTITLNGEVLVSPTGPLQFRITTNIAQVPTLLQGSLTSELIRYI